MLRDEGEGGGEGLGVGGERASGEDDDQTPEHVQVVGLKLRNGFARFAFQYIGDPAAAKAEARARRD